MKKRKYNIFSGILRTVVYTSSKLNFQDGELKAVVYLKTFQRSLKYLAGAFILPAVLILWVDYKINLKVLEHELLKSAGTVPLLLPEYFQDHAPRPELHLPGEEEQTMERLQNFADSSGLTRIYTLIYMESRFFVTADSKGLPRDDGAYLKKISGESSPFQKAWAAKRAFYSRSIQGGRGRTVILPSRSPEGTPYLICVEISRSMMNRRLFGLTGLQAGFLLLGFLLILVYVCYLTNTNPGRIKPSSFILMKRTDLDKIMEIQSRHLQELSEHERINNLQLTNALYAGRMSLFAFHTDTGKIDHAFNNLFFETLGYEHGQYKMNLNWLMENIIAPEFRPELLKVYQDMVSGKINQETMDVKLKNIRENYKWFRLHLSLEKSNSKGKGDTFLALIQSIEDVKLRERDLLKQVQTDELTGLYNRSYWEEYFQSLKSRNRRSDMPLVICFMDINGLKTVNDNLGHNAGDKLLTDFAGILQKTIRGSDMAVRLGGDEFLLICPQTNEAEFEELWERLMKRTEKFNRTMDRDYQLSFSHGICVLFDLSDQDEIDALLEEADRKMYDEKRIMKKGKLNILRSSISHRDSAH